MSNEKPTRNVSDKKPPVPEVPPVRLAADGGLAPWNRLIDSQENRSATTGRYLPVPHTHPDPAQDPVAQAAAFAAAVGEPWTEHDSRSHDARRAMFDTLHSSQPQDDKGSDDA